VIGVMMPLLLWPLTLSARQQVKELVTDSITVCQLLREASQLPVSANLPLFFAKKFIGRPYVAATLEGNDPECLVVNTRQLDCTTLVENVVALTLCVQRRNLSYHAYKHALIDMRYRGGVIRGYTSRLHYFTDWIVENAKSGLVTEIQNPQPPFSAVQKVSVSYMSEHPQSYEALKRHPEYVSRIRGTEQKLSGLQFRFIPKSDVGKSQLLRKAINDGDIIAITCKKPGLDIAHLGFAVWKNDGLHLLNASQLHKKVVLEPMTLYQYLQKHPSHTGIRIIRINK
jgi:hypothetical protein